MKTPVYPATPGGILGAALPTDRTLVMGVVNATPDSFSDGGKWNSLEAAVERAHYLLENGADLIDLGGESTRPGSTRLTPAEEQVRILEIVSTLAEQGVVVSVDTVHASTAKLAVAAGAAIINDVSGACFDPQMAAVMAETDAVVVIQHWRGFPGTPSERLLTENVVETLLQELQAQVRAVEAAGVKPERIIVDPGFGFAKDVTASWQVLYSLGQIEDFFPYPVLVGTSRKRMLKDLSDARTNIDDLTAATSLVAAQNGAWAVRVHEPAGSLAAVKVAQRLNHV